MKNIGIIGGGIIGLCSAYYLNKSGHKVTIIDKGNLDDGCSFGNAGMIVPSHFIPLAAPGMLSKGIRWMFDSKSPFYVRPRFSGDLIKWGYQFYRKSTQAHVERAIPVLKDLSLLSKALYAQLAMELPFDFGFQQRGLLMLYQTEDTEREERETANKANQIGVEAHVLDLAEIQKLEPDVKVTARGAVYFPGDAHVTPQQLVGQLIPFLKTNGVQFRTAESITDFVIDEGRVRAVKTVTDEYHFDELLIAAGSWSGLLCSKLGLSLPMQAGKGYSFTLTERVKNIRIPSIFLEPRVAVTPMGNAIRFGGTMEISGLDPSVNMNRVRGIVESIPRYYPEMKIDIPKKEDVWYGFRPCSPDGLPYVGRLKKMKNVTIASGHSMMGLSLGPATGKLVSELMNEERTSMDLAALDPERFA